MSNIKFNNIKDFTSNHFKEIGICVIFITAMILLILLNKSEDYKVEEAKKNKKINYEKIEDISDVNESEQEEDTEEDFDASLPTLKLSNVSAELLDSLDTNEEDLTKLFQNFANDNGLSYTQEVEYVESHEDELDSNCIYYYFYFKGEKLDTKEMTLKSYNGTFSIQYGFTPYQYEQ